MVSPISSPSRRFCPALGASLPVQRCVGERILKLNCPITCQFNPFNPDAPKAFDAIVGRGLAGASRWLEKTLGAQEWSRRFNVMDRRFMPERDLPLITYETQWSILNLAFEGQAYPEVGAALTGKAPGGLKNDARLVFNKLARSRALLLQVSEANDALPYYQVRNVFKPEEEFLYVDFGDQEPLEAGAVMFGRFLIHENCIYVIPGVFVGTSDVLGLIIDAIVEFLDEPLESIDEALQVLLPEIWNLCTAIQDERDGVTFGDEAEGLPQEDPCRVHFDLEVAKETAVERLRNHALFSELDASEHGFGPLDETVFEVSVRPGQPPLAPSIDEELDEEDLDPEQESADAPLRVGSVILSSDKLEITALNPVEMELLKALVLQLVPCAE